MLVVIGTDCIGSYKSNYHTSNPPDEEEHSWWRLLSQICGLMVGTGIMVIIALYEEQMKNILD
jgi:hypothetical protein